MRQPSPPPPTRCALRAACLVAWLMAASAPAVAQVTAANLADLSLEQLSSIEVTSVGKRVQRLADVPGSVFVISQDDIRRSGAVTLPEVLRLAPNLHVARADANQYAITSRGFSSVLANKMLVLIDGRTVYSPLFSGVFWEAQDTLLEDIERIEVLSGAGGTLYGSNAVNGVINIITRSAAETSGGLFKLGAGNQENVAAARWGGTSAGGLHWRAYGKRYETDATHTESGAAVRDAARRVQAGFRTDRVRERDQFTLQGDLYELVADQVPQARRVQGANLLARWTRDQGPGARSQLQLYFDRSERRQPGTVDDRLDTWDIEFQQTSRPGPAHELLWGAGYRFHDDRVENLAPALLRFDPDRRRLHLADVFVQDEITLTPGLRLTAGLKAEHNSYTGLEWLPNARLAWQAAPEHLVWAAVSRAVRTPSRIDRDVVTSQLTLGGARFDSEVANVVEVGLRGQPRPSFSYSLALFHHRFDRLRSIDVQPGGLAFGNSHEGRLTGLEAWARWRIDERWRVHAGYVHQRMRLGTEAGSSAVPGGETQLGNDPRHRAQLGISWNMAANMELDLFVRHVGRLPNPAVPSYTAVDLRWGWRVRPDLELSLAVRNLTDRHHVEWGAAANRAELDRSVMLKAIWRP